MGAVIKTLKNLFTGNFVYPVTKFQAVYDDDGTRLDNKLSYVMSAVSRPNILINGNFSNVVNQRHKTGDIVPGYFCADRWYVSGGVGTYAENDGYISFTCQSGAYSTFTQKLENPNQYVGKTMTLSMKYRASGEYASMSMSAVGTEISNSYSVLEELVCDGRWHTVAVTFTIPNISIDRMPVGFGFLKEDSSVLTSSSRIDVQWIKLEYGKYATEFAPRLYQEELALCQRFYWRVGSDTSYSYMFTGNCASTTKANIPVRFPVQMASKPTLGYSAIGNLMILCTATTRAITAMSIDTELDNYGANLVVTSASLTAGYAAILTLSTNGKNDGGLYIEFDAEI